MSELHRNTIEFSTFDQEARAVLEWPNDTQFERNALRDVAQWPKHMERALGAMARASDTREGPRPRAAWIRCLVKTMTDLGADLV